MAKKGVIAGRLGQKYLTFGGNDHVLLYAPTREDKGVGVVIPNLLNWPDSCIVCDMKKENWRLTADFRAKHQKVFLFSPLDKETARYNPLAYIDKNSEHCITEL